MTGRARNQRRKARKLREQQTSEPLTMGDLPERVQTLLRMLQYRRPANSATETAFVARFLKPLGVKADDAGNLWLDVLSNGERPDILWSSHTDTVHKEQGLQRVLYGDGVATSEGSNCLGADCTVGVWLMQQMILASVPGRYVFHAEEEIGGLGSNWVASKGKSYLDGIKYAIAFDRKGTNEIITHQAYERGASDAFAGSLAAILHPLGYKSSDGGTFTDTANYFGIVPECTNISVGYYNQHTSKELLDVDHACVLLDRILTADFSSLVCERDPNAVEYDYGYGWQDYTPTKFDNARRYRDYDNGHDPDATLEGFVFRNPSNVADFLIAHGFTSDDIEDWLWGRTTPAKRSTTSAAVRDAVKRWQEGPTPSLYGGAVPDRYSAATRAVAHRFPDDCPDDEEPYTAEDAERLELPFWTDGEG